ncbi:tetratricopeptide repeat protein [Azospirillum doebereinerae]|uniref:tetratricopeptide repeat protein n=1 Tax=Azospirillum doebereinerae TaxID=92933 RepID=UPI001EE62D9E|nr:hypothetical protein [Azospirillum doebereinerae]MCG5238962.1 hypothetical protein [Azospirillum doebereinerae]
MLANIANSLLQSGKEKEAAVLYRISLCFDPQDGEALYRLGLLQLKDGANSAGAWLIRRAIFLRGIDPASIKEIMLSVNDIYVASMKDCTGQDGAIYRINTLNKIEALIGVINIVPILYAAAVYLAGKIGKYDIARKYFMESLSIKFSIDRDNLLTLMRSGLYLISMAEADDDIVDSLYKRSKALLKNGENIDVAYFCVLYKKYYDGKYIVSQGLAKKARKKLGDKEFFGSNLMNTWHICRYDNIFFQNIKSYDVMAALVGPIRHEKRLPASDKPVILVSCDARYLELLGVKLLESIRLVGAHGNVHLHVINATERSRDIVAEIESSSGTSLGLSTEETSNIWKGSALHKRADFIKTYYACARFIRIPEFSRLYGRPIVQIDTDCLLTSDLLELPICNQEADVGFLFDGIRTGPARQFNATFFFLNNHAKSLEYAELVARYVAHFIVFDLPLWGLDQAALYCVYRYMQRHGTEPTAASIPSWELFQHLVASGEDSMEGKIRRLDERLATLRTDVAAGRVPATVLS